MYELTKEQVIGVRMAIIDCLVRLVYVEDVFRAYGCECHINWCHEQINILRVILVQDLLVSFLRGL